MKIFLSSSSSSIVITATNLLALLLLSQPTYTNGHGHMYSPRSRNWVAYEDGTDQANIPSTPPKDYCYYCLNKKSATDVCGVGNAQSYDHWKDSAGNPMPWDSQATYTEGDVIEIKSYLHTPHWGHQDVMICPDGDESTQECFEAHPLEFVADLSYGAPKDANYPHRGHYTGAFVDFTMTFKLPMGVTGDKVLMQWRYVTANSCWPPGYESYPYDEAKGGNSLTCEYPLDPTGAVGTGKPEQFWNCAEITILPRNPTPPPVPTPPTVTPPTPHPTTVAPVGATPPTTPACCSWPPFEQCSQPENTWCQSSKQNCEGSCSGKWLGGGTATPPTNNNPPATPPSTNAPVVPTSPSPVVVAPPTTTTPTRGCCSINFKTCHHDVGTFCWESEENCRGPCGKYWLPTGEIGGCAGQWEACVNDEDCCGPGTCGSDGTCAADGWNYTPSPTTNDNSPVSSPTTPAPVTSSPVTTTAAPTPSPSLQPSAEKTETESPTKKPSTAQPLTCKTWCEGATATWPQKCKWDNCNGCPACRPSSTPSPTTSPITAAPDPVANCCTWNLYNCGVDAWCNEKEENCHAVCGGVYIETSSLAMACLAKYQQCRGGDGDGDDCCDSLTCQGGEGYKQCL